tara:strand:+ start:946 stop:1182 length:237 start_codon:yes stop_codon:yes gene_type:complete
MNFHHYQLTIDIIFPLPIFYKSFIGAGIIFGEYNVVTGVGTSRTGTWGNNDHKFISAKKVMVTTSTPVDVACPLHSSI